MILIGSRAIKLRNSSLLMREPKDFDFVCTFQEYEQWMEKNAHKVNPTKVYALSEYNKQIVEGTTNCEFEIITKSHSSELLADLVYNDSNSIETSFGFIPTLDVLFTIKDSHKYKKFHYDASGFWKTAMDWHILQRAGAQIKPEYQAFHKLRKAEAYAGQKHPKLNVNKDDFFKDDGIAYLYDHDDIHRAICVDRKPAYEYYLTDNETVKCSKDKFFAVEEKIRLNGVCEEACVLALERSKIHNPHLSSDQVWFFACAKVLTSITSGFFREYGFNNLLEVIKVYKAEYSDYYEKFNMAVQNNLVKPFNKITM